MFSKLYFEYVCTAEKAELKGKCKNNLIRSAFGASLRRDEVAYQGVFEGRLLELVGIRKDRMSFFSPECFEEKKRFKQGEELAFQMNFLALNTFWQDVCPAFVNMLTKAGFALKGIWAMPRLGLETQPCNWPMVANSKERARAVPEFDIDEVLSYYRIEQPISELEIQLVTPLRLERGGKLVQNPSFADIVFACFRRIEKFYSLFFMDGHNPLTELAKIPETSLAIPSTGAVEWRDWYRKPTKTEKPMAMGGAIGNIKVFCNEPPYLNPFIPLLMAGQYLHIGKAITMGNGLIRVKW